MGNSRESDTEWLLNQMRDTGRLLPEVEDTTPQTLHRELLRFRRSIRDDTRPCMEAFWQKICEQRVADSQKSISSAGLRDEKGEMLSQRHLANLFSKGPFGACSQVPRLQFVTVLQAIDAVAETGLLNEHLASSERRFTDFLPKAEASQTEGCPFKKTMVEAFHAERETASGMPLTGDFTAFGPRNFKSFIEGEITPGLRVNAGLCFVALVKLERIAGLDKRRFLNLIKNSTWLVRALARQGEYGFVAIEEMLEFSTPLSKSSYGVADLLDPDCFELVDIETSRERLELTQETLRENAVPLIRKVKANPERIECGGLKVVHDGVDAVSSSLLWSAEILVSQFSHIRTALQDY